MRTAKSIAYLLGVYVGTIACIVAEAGFALKDWIKEKWEDK